MCLSNELACEAGSFSCCCFNFHGCFHQRFEALFPRAGALGCMICFAPRHSSRLIYVQMWGHRVCQPPPCGVCQLQSDLLCSTIRHLTGSTSRRLGTSPLRPGCPSPPLLPVWMNVSSLSPWLSDPCSSIFCQFWLFFVFKLLSFFWLCKEAQCVYLCPHLGRKSNLLY